MSYLFIIYEIALREANIWHKAGTKGGERGSRQDSSMSPEAGPGPGAGILAPESRVNRPQSISKYLLSDYSMGSCSLVEGKMCVNPVYFPWPVPSGHIITTTSMNDCN